jgi:hypothetical protein
MVGRGRTSDWPSSDSKGRLGFGAAAEVHSASRGADHLCPGAGRGDLRDEEIAAEPVGGDERPDGLMA